MENVRATAVVSSICPAMLNELTKSMQKVTVQLTVSTAAKSGLAATLVVRHILLLHLLLQYFFSDILFA